LDVEKSVAEFYGVEGALLLTLHVVNPSSQLKENNSTIIQKTTLQISPQDESKRVSDFLSNMSEFELQTPSTSLPNSNSTPAEKDNKNKSNKEEATYSKLYRDIKFKNDIYDIPEMGIPIMKNEPVKPTKVGRNDDCPCGSGKKYKKCHGK